ncbi:oocyte zinc finger protein XlCOF6-like [Ochlerotatus camptorhynchus]|uniref:oocyte zinc finger protein XlCOF6-like n=1 Tax=Ochlerotatus camptorhynchus TaxID=644619 RepID=UPI0031DE0BEB
MKTETGAHQQVPDSSGMCRTCMQSGSPSDALLPLSADLEEDAPIVSVICELTAIQIDPDDGLPEGICGGCVEEMKRFVAFIKKVRISDRKLRQMFKSAGASGTEAALVKIKIENNFCKEELVVDDKLEEVLEEVVVEEEYLDLDDGVEWKLEQRSEDEPTQSTFEVTAETSSEVEFIGFDEAEEEPSAEAIPDLTTRGTKRKRKPYRSKDEPGIDYSVLDEIEQETYTTMELSENDHLCCACYQVFETAEELKDHCEEHNKKTRLNIMKPNVCEICFRRYTNSQGLDMHRKQSQKTTKIYECIRCKARFINSKTRRQHAHNHPQTEVIQSSVIAPIRIQANYRSGRICCAQGCGEAFRTDEELIEHAHEAHRLNKFAANLPEYQDKPFECPVCFKRFYAQKTLMKHQKRKYKNPFRQCSICGAKVHSAVALAAHERMHIGEKPFQCSTCDKFFVSAALLKAHSIVHRKDKPFICPVCGRGFQRKATLQKHELIHAGVLAFECEVCAKPFRTKPRLELHMRSHTGVKPYPCRYCDKSFADHSNRQRHEMGHTGIKPYKCSQCDKTFITKRLQAEHETTNHAIATVYTCNQCLESFTNRASLNKHIALHDE